MNTTTAHTQALAAHKLMRASLLALLCAGSLLVCQRAFAVEADFDLASQDVALVETAPAATQPRTGRLLLAVTRLGERVMRLTPWHRQTTPQACAHRPSGRCGRRHPDGRRGINPGA